MLNFPARKQRQLLFKLNYRKLPFDEKGIGELMTAVIFILSHRNAEEEALKRFPDEYTHILALSSLLW